MEKLNFWAVTDCRHPHGDVIYAKHHQLRIKVSCPEKYGWEFSANEVQLFAYADGQLLVFETIGIQPDDAIDVPAAIRWYADYIDLSDFLIMTEIPEEYGGQLSTKGQTIPHYERINIFSLLSANN